MIYYNGKRGDEKYGFLIIDLKCFLFKVDVYPFL